MANTPVINGHRYGWASVELAQDGVDQPEFTEVSYTVTQEVGDVRGKGTRVRGTTQGESGVDGSVTMTLGQAAIFERSLGKGFMKKKFPLTVSYSEDGEGDMITDELIGCQITSREVNPSQGTDPVTVTYELHILRIKLNGLDPHGDE